MKKIWQRKWLVLIVTVVVFLSVGAVAWAATSGGQTDETTAALADDGAGVAAAAQACDGDCAEDCAVLGAADCDGDCAALGAAGLEALGDGLGDRLRRAGAALREAFRDKVDQWTQRHGKLMDALRDDMTPEDQALYDQLVEQAEQQRESLQEARTDLAETLKQLRDLADKYLDDES